MVREGNTKDNFNEFGRLKQIVDVLNDCSSYHLKFRFDLLQFVEVYVTVRDKQLITAINLLEATDFLFSLVVFRSGRCLNFFFELDLHFSFIRFVLINVLHLTRD
jgi:hypothetical protein